MKFVFAGHNNQDPGACANGHTEASWTKIFRNGIVEQLQAKGHGATTKVDNDDDSLVTALSKAKTGSGSVVLDLHLDSGPETATGCSVFVADDASKLSIDFAEKAVLICSECFDLKIRDGGDGDGINHEADSHRKRLGVMRESGQVALLELGFISNASDMLKIQDIKRRELFFSRMADLLIEREGLVE